MPFLISPLLWLCMALSAGGCNPNQDPTGPEPSQTLTATEIAGIRLTYMCGNTFRVRNPNAQEVMVTWDVYQKSETGSLTLPPKPAGALHSETFFTTVNKGTVRLFYNGQLIQTKANGNKPACQVTADTTTPPVPTSFAPPPDSARTVAVPSDPEVRYHRNLVGVIFDDSTSGTTVNALLRKYQATVVGGFPGRGTRGAYMLQIPDTVTTYEGLQSLVNQMGGEVGVDYAFGTTWRDKFVPRGRYPDDGVGSRRSDWTSPHFGSATAPWRAIRAPLAWGCETGAYGSGRVPVGIIDFPFETAHQDLASSTKSLLEAPLNSMAASSFLNDPADGRLHRSHGTAVTGVLAAQGDNNLGIAGMLWRADLKLYAYGRGTDETQSAASFLADSVFPDARRRSVRVLLTSLGAGLGNDTNAVRSIRDELRLYLQANNGSVLVLATGNGSRRIPGATALSTPHSTFTALDRAALELYPSFPRQIIFVSGTDNQGALSPFADVWIGATWVAAPSVDITTLARTSEYPAGIDVRSGTSYAAPFVAGVAAQLLAMDPSLSGSAVGDYIYRGSRVGDYSATLDQYVSSTAVPVPGTSEVYQLNAYQALRLLAQDRSTAPICGYEVALSGSNILLERNPPTTPGIIPVSGLGTPYHISVAQGGRLISVSGYVDPTGASDERRAGVYQLQAGQWALQRTLSGIDERTYLERDTLDIRWGVVPQPDGSDDSGPYVTLTRERGTSRQTLFLPAQLKGNAINISLHRPSAAPSGDWIAVGGSYAQQVCNPGCITFRVQLIRWSDLASTLVKQTTWDVLENGSQYTGDFYQSLNLLWSHSGLRFDALYSVGSQRAIDEFNTIEATGSRLYSQPASVATEVTLLADQTVDNVVPMSPGYLSADDSVLFIDEQPFQSSSCSRARRQLTQLTTLSGTTLGCFGEQYFPMGRLMAVLGKVSGQQNKAAGELKRRTLPTPAENRRAVLASQPRRVRVN